MTLETAGSVRLHDKTLSTPDTEEPVFFGIQYGGWVNSACIEDTSSMQVVIALTSKAQKRPTTFRGHKILTLDELSKSDFPYPPEPDEDDEEDDE